MKIFLNINCWKKRYKPGNNLEGGGLDSIKLGSELKYNQEKLKILEEKLYSFYPHKVFMLCNLVRDVFGIYGNMGSGFYNFFIISKILEEYSKIYNESRFRILKKMPKDVKYDEFYKYFCIFDKTCKTLKQIEDYINNLESIRNFFEKNRNIIEKFFNGNSIVIKKICNVSDLISWVNIAKKCADVWKGEIEKIKIAICGKFFEIIKNYIEEKIEDERIYFDCNEDVSEQLNRISALEYYLKDLNFSKLKFSGLFSISLKPIKKCADGEKENL